jgi:hypothetical protein
MNEDNNFPKLIVHTVHGTWPYGLWAHIVRKTPQVTGAEPPWFSLGSSFQNTVTALCGRNVEWITFKWSGDNSFYERHLAAKALSQHLLDWFEREPQAEHLIIAHSHGGTVSVAAARELDAQGHNTLSRIITLATPFAQAIPSKRDDRELAMRYMILRFGWVPITLFFCLLYLSTYGGEVFAIFGVFSIYQSIMIFLIVPTFLICWKIGIIKFMPPIYRESISTASQAWRLYAIRAPRDEATIAINTSQFIDLVSNLLFARCILAPFDWFRRHRGRIWLILFLLMLFGVMWSLTFTEPTIMLRVDSIQSVMALLAGLVVAIPVLMLVTVVSVSSAIFVAVALGGSLILIPANVVLATALGIDMMRFRGLMQIECEPIPSGVTGTVTTINLSQDEQDRLGLVHFIHATQAARARVGELLRAASTVS